jgi:hypothetical protein
MPTQDLLTISTIAFGFVLVLLSVLAGMIRLIMLLFPAKAEESDTALVAAVTSVYSTLYPGTKLTTMEEVK